MLRSKSTVDRHGYLFPNEDHKKVMDKWSEILIPVRESTLARSSPVGKLRAVSRTI
jgi:hypothetical protein